MSRSLFCFTVGHNSSYAQLTERLKELAEDSNRKNSFSVPFSDEELGCGVQQVVVSSSHLALLLEDGRVLRVAYGLASDTGSVLVSKDKSDDDCASTSSALSVGSRSTSPRPDLDEGGGSGGGGSGSGLSSIVHRFSSLVSGSSRLSATSRSRILLGRRMGRLLGRVHSTVPSTEVPERLVEQAMAVLQGKSREVVIRELQRTNLDVNSAVNNLLSRDDEDGGGDHEDAVLGFLPSGEELLSLVGSGVLAEEELEELINVSGRNREEAAGRGRERELRALYDDPVVQQEIRSWVTLADRAAGGPGASSSLGSSSASGRHTTNTLPIHLHHDSASSLVRFGSHLLCWREGDQDLRFTAIAGLSSELLAVDCDGNLKRWLWSAPQPVPGAHPRSCELGLEGEKIRLLSARLLRATAVTRNGGVVTWLDDAASSVGRLLEHSVKTLPELSNETISNIYTSELFSVASTDTGRLFWWGVLPFSECKHVIAVAQDRSHSLPSSLLRGESITEGSKVRLRSRPIFSVGCRAIHIKGHKVQCGELQEAVFSLNDKCRFRVISPSSSREESKDTLGPGPSLGSKRSHPGSGEEEEEEEEGNKEEEAMWGLRDVVFVDPPLSSAPVGVVKKLDGLYAAVLFPSSLKADEKEDGEKESNTLKRCRLLRKDDLILISSDGSVGDPLCIQSTPKRLRLLADSTMRSICVDTRGVTLLVSSQGGLSCCSFNMDSGRVTINSPFPQPSAIFLLQQMVPHLHLNLFSIGLNLWLLEDGKGGLYPLGYDCAGNMKHLPFLHLPPAHVVATAPCSGKHLLVAVVFHSQRLLPLVRRGNASGVLSLLNSITSEEVQQCLKEETSGGCNVLHVIAALTAPVPPPPSSSSSSAGGPRSHHSRHSGLREMMKHALALASSSGSSNVEARLSAAMADQGSGEEDMEEGDHSTAARGLSSSFILCLDHICSFASREPQVLLSLMQACNLEGFTPFMSAVFQKSYSVALKLFDLAIQLSSDDTTLVSMLFPPGSHPDDNPVFVLCRGDPCSFTWTGQEHIYQDIFECRTCGLMGTLCCCTECAYICHRGHNCSFKRASPNAYCDCWEKCSCKALARMDSGMMGMRMTLLLRLIKYPSMSTAVNARGEHLLEMLIGITARQKREQHQWAGRRSGPLRQHHHRSLRFEYSSETPAHNMDPPRFASRALNVVMEDWTSVLETLMSGTEQRKVTEEKGGVGEWPFFLTSAEQHQVLSGQSTTQHLDHFTNTLLSRMCHPVIETLVTTLVQQLMTNRRDKTVITCCERFIRSVLRVMVVGEVEKRGSSASAVLVTSSGSSKRRSSSTENDHSALYKEATYVLNSLVPLALPQLLSMARAVILPVCMGVVRPFSPSLMSDRHKIASELFQLPPADLYRLPKRPSAPSSGTPVVLDLMTEPSDSGSEGEAEAEAEAENEEVHTHGDASSTATVGSNPIPFFSDQESSDNEELESVGEEESLDGTDVMADEETYSITSDGPFHSRVHGHTHWAIPDYTGNVRRLSHSSNNKNTASVRVTTNLLGQAFSLLMRLVVELLQTLPAEGPHPPFVLPTLPADEERIHEELWTVLKPVWEWLSTVMDSTEAQLRLGCSLSGGGLTENVTGKATNVSSSSSGRSSDTTSSESKRGFLSYLLSVMRCESNEHADCLPALDIGRMEHVAYVLDALVSLLRNTPASKCGVLEQHSLAAESMTRFFRRSNSTVCLGYPPPSPFGPLVESLPLAEQPQLLHPCQTKETMFGFTTQGNMTVWPRTTLPPSNFLPLIDHAVPVSAGLSHADRGHRVAGDASIAVGVELSRDQVVCENSYSLTACVLMGRWCMTIDLLSQAFAENISKGNLSVFSGLRSFEVMEREFRREMDSLKTSAHRDLQFEVDRTRDKLLTGVFSHLNSTCDFRRSSGGGQPLSTHRLKVVFTNEPGEGSGVVRSFFTAFAEAVLSEECLPEEQQSSRAGSKLILPDYSQDFMLFKRRGYQQDAMMEGSDSDGERCPLFFQPGKPGFYSVRAGPPTPSRLNAYRNVGRIIGLALLHSEVLPLPLCRHVYKYLINRTVSWHDLAFHDPVMYESMRKLIIDAKENGDSLTGIDISWQVMLGPCEGGKVHDLHPNTSDQLVSAATVYEYVHKYAKLRMVGVVEESLQMMRTGLCDVLPTNVLNNFTAEELRLLLCGTPQVDTDALRKITSFVDESRKGAEMVARFKTWFWAVVERMSQRERQDLLYFWTSSPAMPANPESYQPHPSVTVRPADDQHLPTANTCISRLYLPLYSSKSLLRAKLLSAIKIKTFGFI